MDDSENVPSHPVTSDFTLEKNIAHGDVPPASWPSFFLPWHILSIHFCPITVIAKVRYPIEQRKGESNLRWADPQHPPVAGFNVI